MVSGTGTVEPIEGIVHKELNTKCFLGSEDCGNGTLYITESFLQWLGQDKNVKVDYPSISLHAICRDTEHFPYECLYCLLESDETEKVVSDECDPLPEVTEVRFVPSNNNSIQIMYNAITTCQELHPDPEDDDSDEGGEGFMEDEGYEGAEEYSEMISMEGNQFYTADDNLDEVELSEDGQAVLARLSQNMQIANQEELGQMVEQHIKNGEDRQFEDAEEMP